MKNVMTVILSYKNRYDNLLFNLASIDDCIQYDPNGVNVILVDFGSDDPISFPDKKWLEIIRVDEATKIFHKARAINIAIRKVTTPYICCTDVDQIYQENFFACVVNHLKSIHNPFVYCKTYDLRTNNFLDMKRDLIPEKLKDDYVKLLTLGKENKRLHGAGCCQATTREWFTTVRGYDEGFIGRGCQDSDLLRRAKMSGLQLLDITGKTSMLHLPHSLDRNGYYDGATRRKNRVYYDKVIAKKSIIANKNGNWGKTSLNEPNDSNIKQELKRKFFQKKNQKPR